MADKEKLTPQQEHAEPTKETREAQAAPDPEQKPAETPADDLLYKQYISKEDIEIDPETGKITEATRERILAALNEHAIDLEKQNGIFAEIEKLAAAGVKKPKNINITKRNESAAEVVARRINAAVKDAATALTNAQKIADLIIKIAGALNVDTARDILLEMRETFSVLAAMAEEITELEPYLNTELEKLNKPEYKGKTFYQVFYSNDYEAIDIYELYTDPESDLSKILAAARKAKSADLLDIETYRADKLNMPIDKSNFISWNDFTATDDQIKLKIDMMSEKDRRDPERSLLDISMRYSLTFDNDPNIKTTKNINHYDRRLTQALDTLYESGKDICLISEIFYNMGGTGRLGDTQIEKINSSLTKQGTARVYINNKSEAAHYDYPEIEYDGNLLNFERIRVRYRGKEREAIKILRRPVIMEFADQRDQITAIPMKVLQSKISKTDKNLRIEDYLLHRIARRKNDINELQEKQKGKYTKDRQKKINQKRELTILLPTFYEQTGNADKKSNVKQRALNTARKFLDHYKSEAAGKYIEDYKIDAERIKITLPIQ